MNKANGVIPDSSDSDLLNDAYQRVRAAPESADANLELAIALMRQGNLEEAAGHARVAARHATSDWPKLSQLGVVLFQLSELFPLAYTVLDRAARNGPMEAEPLRILAALYHRNGEAENARRCIAATAQLETVVGPRHPSPDLPMVLRLRSVEKSFYGIKTHRKTGLRYCWLKGGHFSDANLTDPERINLYIATVFGDNLNNVDSLPDFDLFMNAVSCADLDPEGLNRIEMFVARFPDVPVINPPDKVRRTTRAENARRLNALPGVRMPRTELFVLDRPPDETAARMEESGFGYPVIVRHRGTQTGKTMEKIDTRPALVTWLSEQASGTPIYAIEYVDCQGSDGYHHKTRCFFIDGTFYPVANLSCDTWQIHSGDRYRVMSSTPTTQEAEKRYLGDPEAYLGSKAFRALHAIRDTIDLDFFGIDFTLDADGKVLVFEANAAMRHNFDHAENFPYTRPYLERISQAFADMVDLRAGKKPDVVGTPPARVADRPSSPDVPTLNLAPFLEPNGKLSAESTSRLVAGLIARLGVPPYWLVLVTGQDPIDLDMLEQVMRAMGEEGAAPGSEPQRISRTRVRVDPQQAAREGNVTRYSRTPDALPLHTDCSNNTVPANLVAFAMERPDGQGGGASVMLPASDLIKEVPAELVERLRQPLFPFTRQRRFPILDGEGDELRIRYYRNQVASALDAQAGAGGVPAELIGALDELDRYLEASPQSVRFQLQAGDVLLMDNQRVLHGRSAMPAGSDRLMHRFRLSCPSLASKEA